MAVEHYENFPVASWLAPARLRPAIASIYWFARTADDLADEGEASAEARLAQLAAYRAELHTAAQDAVHPSSAWPRIFTPLAQTIRQYQLPVALLDDLLKAFEQDVHYTRAGHWYADHHELLAYSSLSANPVGRLLLHLYGVQSERALAQSDSICSALQFINFWQDISRDLPRQRYYLPLDILAAHGLQPDDVQQRLHQPDLQPAICSAIAECCQVAHALMRQGAPLATTLPASVDKRIGWELRLVVLGGLRILEKIQDQAYTTHLQRPAITRLDAPLLGWRALRYQAYLNRQEARV